MIVLKSNLALDDFIMITGGVAIRFIAYDSSISRSGSRRRDPA